MNKIITQLEFLYFLDTNKAVDKIHYIITQSIWPLKIYFYSLILIKKTCGNKRTLSDVIIHT